MVPRDIVCLLGDIGHDVMLTVLENEVNSSTSWWKSYSNLKYVIFDKGVV